MTLTTYVARKVDLITICAEYEYCLNSYHEFKSSTKSVGLDLASAPAGPGLLDVTVSYPSGTWCYKQLLMHRV